MSRTEKDTSRTPFLASSPPRTLGQQLDNVCRAPSQAVAHDLDLLSRQPHRLPCPILTAYAIKSRLLLSFPIPMQDPAQCLAASAARSSDQ